MGSIWNAFDAHVTEISAEEGYQNIEIAVVNDGKQNDVNEAVDYIAMIRSQFRDHSTIVNPVGLLSAFRARHATAEDLAGEGKVANSNHEIFAHIGTRLNMNRYEGKNRCPISAGKSRQAVTEVNCEEHRFASVGGCTL